MLLVWKVDRLARNVGDHFNITTSLKKQGIQVVSVTEPIDAKPEGKLLETILAGFAQFDNDLRAARTLQGMRRKIQEGLFPWKAPLGYKTVNPRGSKKTAPDVPDEPLFGLLRRAWHEFATGAHTKAELLRMMTAWGIKTRNGDPIPKQSLDKMLRDPFYAGIIRDPWGDKEYPGRHLALVSKEIFNRVQSVIEGRNRSIRHNVVRIEFPLRQFARCTACNDYLTGSFSRGRSRYYPYYHCFHKACGEPTYANARVVHSEFMEFLYSITPNQDAIKRLDDSITTAVRERANTISTRRERRQLELERLDQQNDQLIKMKMENLITSDEFTAHKARISKRLRELDIEEGPNAFEAPHTRSLIEEISDPLMNLNTTWMEIPPALKQRFQRVILPNGFAVQRIGTAQMSDLFSALSPSRLQMSTLVAPTCQSSNLMREIEELAQVLRAIHDPAFAA
jgi:hypothetical protein